MKIEQVNEVTEEPLVRLSVPQSVALDGLPAVRTDEASRTVWVIALDAVGLERVGCRRVHEPISDEDFQALKDRREFLVGRREELSAQLDQEKAKLAGLSDMEGGLQAALVEGTADGETVAALGQEREARRFSTEKIASAISAVTGEIMKLDSAIAQEQSLRDKPGQDEQAKPLHQQAAELEKTFVTWASSLSWLLEQRADLEAQRAQMFPLADMIRPLNINTLGELVRKSWQGPSLIEIGPHQMARWIASLLSGPNTSQYAAEMAERKCYTHMHYAPCGECQR